MKNSNNKPPWEWSIDELSDLSPIEWDLMCADHRAIEFIGITLGPKKVSVEADERRLDPDL